MKRIDEKWFWFKLCHFLLIFFFLSCSSPPFYFVCLSCTTSISRSHLNERKIKSLWIAPKKNLREMIKKVVVLRHFHAWNKWFRTFNKLLSSFTTSTSIYLTQRANCLLTCFYCFAYEREKKSFLHLPIHNWMWDIIT